jgi:crooked neck
MSYAQFEMSAAEEGGVVLARQVYERANQSLRAAGEKEERGLLLKAWLDFETQNGDKESLENVAQKMPRKSKKKRRIQADDGVSLFASLIYENPEITFSDNMKSIEKCTVYT